MSRPSAVRGAPVYTEAHPFAAVPLGGIGTGNMAIGADGSLRQWQLHNIGNHQGALPCSFFSIRVSSIEPPVDVVRMLQAEMPAHDPTPLVDDDFQPPWLEDAFRHIAPVQSTRLTATYPIANLTYADDALPIDVALEAFTPLIPFDVADSSIPAALFTFTLSNPGPLAVHGSVGASLLNAVGWDGVSPIDGVRGAGLGGNTNRVTREAGWTLSVMEAAGLDPDDAGAGQMILATDHPAAAVLRQYRTAEEFATFLETRSGADGRERHAGSASRADTLRQTTQGHTGPSIAGETWATGLATPFSIQPGESVQIRFTIAWHFANRYVNFEQFGPARPEWGPSSFWLGNAYARRFADARAVAAHVAAHWGRLRETTMSWTSIFADSTLDDSAADHLAAQLSLVRSPTCFQSADGRFFGFEGVLGASTTMWNGRVGGSCPLNCTHVWNYAQTVAKVFPELERSMRATEFDIMQAPDGSLPHRVIVPVYLPQLWDQMIGGPEEPALDGMLGSILKTYREYRHGAGIEWLRGYWPAVTRLLARVREGWDPAGSGVLRGVQPSTHDIDLRGVNPYMGGLWLAALRAAEECAVALGEDGSEYRSLFELGRRAYDELLFNGEYFQQSTEDGDPQDFQWGAGCLSDQLVGQWWAHELGLGDMFPPDHVRSALRSIVTYNFRDGFRGFEHGYRVYADLDDAGLLLCTWPRGGRPDVPLRYADEVWTGSEYQLAAHCLREGLVDEADRILSALWARYDGTRRNPYNEIECGDHYVRAMAGWSVLEAMAGYQFDATSKTLAFGGLTGGERLPFVTDQAWGLVELVGTELLVECRGGRLSLAMLSVDGVELVRSSGIELGPGQTSKLAVRREGKPAVSVP